MDLEKTITAKLREAEARDKALHVPSGKLSATWLNKPLLEQVLKVIGVPPAPFSDYTLRLFARGKQVEDWVCSLLEGEEQVEVEYNGVVGVIDKIYQGVPVEVKSVKSSQWKWLLKQGPNESYKLQAALYALAMKTDHASVILVTADDFRTMQYDVISADFKPFIDKVVGEVAGTIKNGLLPAFEGRENYQNKPEYADKYSSYPDWVGLPTELAMEKLKNNYPNAYNKLKGVKNGKDN